jgi:hypothetical protein
MEKLGMIGADHDVSQQAKVWLVLQIPSKQQY